MIALAIVFAFAGLPYHQYLYRKLFRSLSDQGVLGFVKKPKTEWTSEEQKLDPDYRDATNTSGRMPQIKRLKKYLSVSSLPDSDQTLLRTSVLA